MSSKVVSNKANLTAKQAIDIYTKLKKIRQFEEKAVVLYGLGLIGGFLHVYSGQEAVVVGLEQASKKGDSHITAYRCHGHGLVFGLSAKSIMAELLGKETGCSKGRGGSMHMFNPEEGFFGGHGIVGSQVPMGAGLAFYHKYKKTGNICFTSMGDGAADQGQVFESLNLAALWKLPVVFIIENNQYSMGTAVNRHSANGGNYTKQALPFDIPHVSANGMDVLEVRDVALEAANHVRSGKGPFLIEFKTYRYRGHSMSDPAKYRSKEEVQEFKEKKDPIENFSKLIIKQGLVKENDLKEIDKKIKIEVEEAAEFAQNSSEPSVDNLYDYVLA